jgi:hypothetical protein
MTLSKDPIKAAEQRERISVAAKKSHADPKWKENQRDTRLKLWEDEAYREKSISNMKLAISDPIIIKKQRENTIFAHTLPEVIESYSNGYKKRSLNLVWIANHAAANEARSIALRGDKCHLHIDGRSFFPYCPKFNRPRKRAARNFFKVCICCGKTIDENIYRVKGGKIHSIELDVHHIDHDKKQGCNGKSFNIVTLCRFCHLDEKQHEEEYKSYINKTLQEGFKWGIWSEEEYIQKVMYTE